VRALAVTLVWIAVAAAAFGIYLYFDHLRASADRERVEAERRSEWAAYTAVLEELRARDVMVEPLRGDEDPAAIARERKELEGTIAGLPRLEPLALSIDSFSGYAILRSRGFHRRLAAEGLRLKLHDDGADYAARLLKLQQGEIPLAVFTVDALIKASHDLGDLPGVIVLVLDETTGADAMVAYKDAVPNLDALNRPDARFVLTRGSPSETLARVVRAHFELSELPRDAWIDAAGAADVHAKLLAADRTAPRAYVLWEPYVSKALEVPGAHVVTDSGRFKGYIADVLVAEKGFLARSAELVLRLAKAYLRERFERHQEGSMAELVLEDARAMKEELTPAQAERLIAGIRWKNTLENYAHFGLVQDAEAKGVQPLSGMIANIARVLVDTGAIARDPTGGNPGVLADPSVARHLHGTRFHPGGSGPEEEIRGDVRLKKLAPEEVGTLVNVGLLRIEPLAFARGGARLSEQSRAALEALAAKLETWPGYYLVVKGHARPEGDPEANRRLAERRAAAAAEFIVEAGIAPERVYAVAAVAAEAAAAEGAAEAGGAAQSVTFDLGQLPY
jgi:flagellar motor protein MotB